MLKKNEFLKLFCRDLQVQHLEDLKIYRAAHQEWRNRVLHWLMVPIECWSALLVSMVMLPSLVTFLVGFGLGCLSVLIATKPSVGMATFCFHLRAIWMCFELKSWGTFQALLIAGGSCTLAWTLQVGVGHWIWEGNQPNVANMKEVPYVAMCQSVLIAWSS
jgi:uncharacterized membrane protein YGL010W